MKVFISDPAVLCRWEHRYSEALIKRGVRTVALIRDGIERTIAPKRTVTVGGWHNQGQQEPEREITVGPTILPPWSETVQKEVGHYIKHFARLGQLTGQYYIDNGWSLADFTEADARADKELKQYDAVLCFSDRRLRAFTEQEEPGFFDAVGGVHVPDHEPRERPKPPTPSVPDRGASFGRIVSTNMADVQSTPPTWLWPGRVPLGMLTIIAGAPGVAKSWVSLYLASRVTTGGIWTDVGRSAPEGPVILLASEDSPEHTIRPRLDALGAIVTKVEKVDMVFSVDGPGAKHFSLSDDLKELETMARAMDARLIIIDPLNSYLGGKQDGFKDVEVRRVLDPLKEMAERLKIAVVLIMHTKKGQEDEIIYGIGGSVAFPAVARSIFFCTRDPESPAGAPQRFYFTHAKINIASEMPPLAYTIDPAAGGVVWGKNPITLTSREILTTQHARKPGPKQTARLDAHQWLLSFLAGGPQTTADAWADATEHGLKPATVRRAMDDLGVLAKPTRLKDGDGSGQITGWTWELPSRSAPPF